MAEAIQGAFDIKCVYSDTILEVFRGIRGQLSNLLSGKHLVRLGNFYVTLICCLKVGYCMPCIAN